MVFMIPFYMSSRLPKKQSIPFSSLSISYRALSRIKDNYSSQTSESEHTLHAFSDHRLKSKAAKLLEKILVMRVWQSESDP